MRKYDEGRYECQGPGREVWLVERDTYRAAVSGISRIKAEVGSDNALKGRM